MITKITAAKIVHVCSNCKAERDILLSDLVAGNQFDPNVIRLPNCSCGSFECLNRAWDHEDATDTWWAKHRKAVNRLHKKLVTANHVHADQAATFAAETEEPQDMWADEDTIEIPRRPGWET